MLRLLIVPIVIAISFAELASAVPSPVGSWTFDDPNQLTQAEVGSDLTLVGSQLAVAGPVPDDGAARIDVGSHYICTHGIAGNGGGQLVNEYTLVMDVQTYGRGLWHCFFQTNEGNANDGDAFISLPGQVGVSDTGYSWPRLLDARTWYRLVFVVDNGNRYEIYADGLLILEGTAQAIDGRFSLDSTMLLFADENGEDGEIDVARISLYDVALSGADVVQLGGLGGIDHFVTRPYLQNVKPDGVSIMWETEQEESALVEYGSDTGYCFSQPAIGRDSGNQTWLFTTVLTDLQPGTTYHYRVSSGEFLSADGTSTTAPAGHAAFSFGVWSDSQGYNHGDHDRDPTEPTRAMMQHMVSQGVDFAVSCGDLAENGGTYTDTRVFYADRPVAVIGGQGVPFFNAWGNHDGGSDSVIRAFADLPSQDRGPPFHAGYGSYSFDYGGCHFICIDYLRETDDIPGWVETDLQSPAARNARFTFLFVHRPPYCERWIDGQQNLREDLVPLLEQYGVDICFSGHTHAYARGELNDVFYCITGGGSWLDYHEPLVHEWPHMTVGGYHDLAPDIDGGLVHEYVEVEVTLTGFVARMHAFHPDGSYREILDTFTEDIEPTGTVDPPGNSPRFGLLPSSPNPLFPHTTIPYRIGAASGAGVFTTLQVYDLGGRLVRDLYAGDRLPGFYQERWDGLDLAGAPVPAGVYLTLLRAGDRQDRGKVVVVK